MGCTVFSLNPVKAMFHKYINFMNMLGMTLSFSKLKCFLCKRDSSNKGADIW